MTKSYQFTADQLVVLAAADDCLVQGHILTSVAGWGPELEINVAVSSMGQDLLGHARLLYSLLVGTEREKINDLIYERPSGEYRADSLSWVYAVEWDILLAKHWLLNLLIPARNMALGLIAIPGLGESVERIRREEEFHGAFWSTWMGRGLNSSDNARTHMVAGVQRVYPLASGYGVALGVKDAGVTLADGLQSLGVTLTDASAEPSLLRDLEDDQQRVMNELKSVYAEAPGSW